MGRDGVTTALGAVGVMGVALALIGGLWPYLGWWSLAVAGMVCIVVSELAHRIGGQP